MHLKCLVRARFETPSFGPPCVGFKDKTLDYGAATLALVDVGSDAIVTKQYWDDAQSSDDFPMFFTLSCGILCVSSIASFSMCCASLIESDDKPCWVKCVVFLGMVPPFGLFLPLLLWRYETTARDKKPEPKLPLKVIVSASSKELFGKGRAVLNVSAANADKAKVEAGPYQVLMVARKPTYEAQDQHFLLRGDWFKRARNTAPIDGEDIGHSIGFDEDKSELYVETKTNSGNVVQSLEWTAAEEAWKVTSTRLGEGGCDHRWALPPRARIRMLHPNVIEVYLPLQRPHITRKGRDGKVMFTGEVVITGDTVISYMFRESEYFEPLRDESLTLEKYQAWLGGREEQDSNLMVWLGTREAPVAPPEPLAADGTGIDPGQVQRELKEREKVFHFSEYLPFVNELSLYQSQKLVQKIRTQAPFSGGDNLRINPTELVADVCHGHLLRGAPRSHKHLSAHLRRHQCGFASCQDLCSLRLDGSPDVFLQGVVSLLRPRLPLLHVHCLVGRAARRSRCL